MVSVIEDTNLVIYNLAERYGLQMYSQKSSLQEKVYLGEVYTIYGKRLIVIFKIRKESTIVQVYDVTGNKKVCIFQKSYSTKNDKKAFSKSVSLIKFLDKQIMN